MTIFNNSEFYAHEKIVFHEHKSSGLKAIVAIHNSNLGPALGGCRMLPYKSEEAALCDVLRLSRSMTYKCAIANIPFGGGKSVIIGDPAVHKTKALLHAMGDLVESLGGDYICSFDSGTSIDDVRIIGERTEHVGGILPGAGNASASTAYGVYTAIKAAVKFRLQSSSLQGVKVAVQGLGNVGLRLVEYLKQAGAEVYVTDVDQQHMATVADRLELNSVSPNDIYGLAVDVFAPCALGAIINNSTLPQIKAAIISGAANNQLATDDLGEQLKDKGILYAPDYVANAGGIIDLHYQFTGGDKLGLRSHLDSLNETLSEIFLQAEIRDQATSLVANKIAEKRFNADH